MRHDRRPAGPTETKSNVKDPDALSAWRNRSIEEQASALRNLRAAFDRGLRDLLRDDAAATAAAIAEKYRHAWDESLVGSIGDNTKMIETRQILRRAMDQSLRKELANYAAIKALQERYGNDYRSLAGTYDGGAGRVAVHPPAWLDGVDNFGLEEFAPPFDVTDIYSFPPGGPPIETNLSSTFPELGLVLNDITWRDNNTFGEMYDTDRVARCDVSLGINFEAPRTGFLNVAVIMRNLFNRIHVSGTDNFGFSSATVSVSHDVYILMLRGGDSAWSQTPVISDGWVDPGGADFSYLFPEVPGGPVVLVGTFDDALHAGEQVQILGGCDTFVQADVSNMDCSASVKMLWQIEMMYVWLT